MRLFSWIAVIGSLLLVASCGNRSSVAYGDANSIIIVAPDSTWTEVGDSVYSILEPRILTVRDERTFEVTQVSPLDPNWTKLRLWRQVMLVGQPDDPWLAPVLAGREEPLPDLPAIIEADDIWARGQRITAVVLPPDDATQRLLDVLPDLHRLLDDRFRAYARQRMFVSGRNDSLHSTLRTEAGFGLLLPKVYTIRHPDGSTYLFRNDNMVGGELIRNIAVTWREGVASDLTPEAVLSWRDSVAEHHYSPGQVSGRDRIETRPLEGFGPGSIEVQGIWHGDDPGFPMAGPFISRAVTCPAQNRTYLLDAWLYAPAKSKYEYMLQLETILGSFECGA